MKNEIHEVQINLIKFWNLVSK